MSGFWKALILLAASTRYRNAVSTIAKKLGNQLSTQTSVTTSGTLDRYANGLQNKEMIFMVLVTNDHVSLCYLAVDHHVQVPQASAPLRVCDRAYARAWPWAYPRGGVPSRFPLALETNAQW